jgi:hypothetical protein
MHPDILVHAIHKVKNFALVELFGPQLENFGLFNSNIQITEAVQW